MFTLVLLLVVLASMRGSFRAGILPARKDTSLLVGRYIPTCRSDSLDAYWYAYQETGDLQSHPTPSGVLIPLQIPILVELLSSFRVGYSCRRIVTWKPGGCRTGSTGVQGFVSMRPTVVAPDGFGSGCPSTACMTTP